MTFDELESKYYALKGKHAGGLLSDEEFLAEVEKLTLQDEHGRWWMIGAKTGKWYVSQAGEWVQAEPPGAAPAAEKVCPQCGAPLEKGAVFCGNCGYRLGPAAQPPPQAPPMSAQPGPASAGPPAPAAAGRPKRGLLIGGAVVLFLLFLSCIGLAAYEYLSPGRPISRLILGPSIPQVVCTPPPCGPGEEYYCPDECPGGCGIVCATPTSAASAAQPTTPPPEFPTPTPELPTATPIKEHASLRNASYKGVSFSYHPSVASDVTAEILPAEESDISPFETWTFPERVGFDFIDYPYTESSWTPYLVVYPLGDFEADNPGAAQLIGDLWDLLSEQPATPDRRIPVLPPPYAAQLMHARVGYLTFENGEGIHFLTQYAQDTVPIVNSELVWQFEGLTDDGRYYVGARFPVSSPLLPDEMAKVDQSQRIAVEENFEGYIEDIERQLAEEPAANFTPDLSLLTATMESVKVEIALTATRKALPVRGSVEI